MSRQIECCPTWLYTIMHQCWVYAPVERPPFIAIFDGASSRLVIINNLKHRTFEIRTYLNVIQAVGKYLAFEVYRYNLRWRELSRKIAEHLFKHMPDHLVHLHETFGIR